MHILKSIHRDFLNHAQLNQHSIHSATHNKARVFIVTTENYTEINYEIYSTELSIGTLMIKSINIHIERSMYTPRNHSNIHIYLHKTVLHTHGNTQ